MSDFSKIEQCNTFFPVLIKYSKDDLTTVGFKVRIFILRESRAHDYPCVSSAVSYYSISLIRFAREQKLTIFNIARNLCYPKHAIYTKPQTQEHVHNDKMYLNSA